ncbi:hypothetical protein, variant [Aphanomyces invadans]|uniref:Uncharacterized protein n=1 Tax=Aphanomyces invadans TaxID=157072 RepID=A0A024TK15_9STRA|nr:hypothetical protein, variant [Aphanomyces invadans]ETV93931.1 hypothetical protein, variant [Aphanomyces invadans]|eukprot:XP_008877490.1 hypothetical protein, variant [Aphanomyces invadans]
MDISTFDIDWTQDACDFDFLLPEDERTATVVEASCNSADDSVTATSQPQRRRRKRTNLLQIELLSLHQEAANLARQLENLQAHRAACLDGLTDTEMKWEKIARNQLQLKLKAIRENHDLRTALADQSKLQQALEDVLLKKPRVMLMKVEDDQWRLLKLGANGEKRLAAIHAIAERQMELMESDMLSLGLVDTNDDLLIVRHNDVAMFSEGIRATAVAGSLAAVGVAAWRTLAIVLGKSCAVGHSCSYAIDSNTLYTRTIFRRPEGRATVSTSVIMKRFVLNDGTTVRVVFRTIFDDEAMPILGKTYAVDQYGWIHMEEHADGSVLYKSFVKSHFVLPNPEDVNDLTALLGELYLEQVALTPPQPPPVDSIAMAKAVFDITFRHFEVVLHDELAKERTKGHVPASSTETASSTDAVISIGSAMPT